MDNMHQQTARTMDSAAVDAGLRSYMLSVYNYMIMAMVLTGIVAYAVSTLATAAPGEGVIALNNGVELTQFGVTIYGSALRYVIMFAPLALIFFISFKINSLSFATAQIVFAVYSALVGASISSILLVYTGESITQVFFITATAFGALSLYGYTTKRSLSAFGSFLIMGLIGLLIAMVVNIFLQSEAFAYIISCVGVLIFAGLTAYDTQKIKETYFRLAGQDNDTYGKAAIMGALNLYLDFLNMFMFLLHLLGDRD